jgi:murein DD-endopeptidase MepM/ murein hydrolase activator NlpD
MRSVSVSRRSRMALCLSLASLCAAQAAWADAEQPVRSPAPLAVRYKEAPPIPIERPSPGRRSGDLFALLGSFPKVVARRSSRRAAEPLALSGAETRAALARNGGNPLPAKREVLSSRFGMRQHPILGVLRPHLGVDLAAPLGTPVYATGDGVVSAAGRRGGYGLAITLEHASGMETRYAHMSRLNVARGQRIQRGSVIGWVGSTGLSTGPHLHYETRVRGRAVNPLVYMRGKK